jgi:cation diffusion facilitator CzcD-associated flavoprotein CzcO
VTHSGSNVDVLIVGAGISGIGAAYHLQQECPSKSYVILERRASFGGTWDLFRYPGIRSDSDMHTFGYAFRPWDKPEVVASGDAILAYLRDTMDEHGIERAIRYGQSVVRASWSSKEARWTVTAADEASGQTQRYTCKFLYMCAGYYDYEEGYTPAFEGIEEFEGEVVHPQKWTEEVDYEGKRIVVIGSGATAVTLIPELAKKAEHVTMLQRSPTYIAAKPNRDAVAALADTVLPKRWAYFLTRWKNILVSIFLYWFCQTFPKAAKGSFLKETRKALGPGFDVEKHFSPRYNPWDQRVCLAPDGDFFRTLRSGAASVVTDHIERFTKDGVRTKSGEVLEADLVVTATGLDLKFLGDIPFEVDGSAVRFPDCFAYKGMMCSDVPNMAMALGYTNATWTLKADLTAEYVCRLIQHMDAHGYDYCCPRMTDPSVEAGTMLPLTSGYIQRGRHKFPKEAAGAPWTLHQNYLLDVVALRHGAVDDDAMEFTRLESRQAPTLMKQPA